MGLASSLAMPALASSSPAGPASGGRRIWPRPDGPVSKARRVSPARRHDKLVDALRSSLWFRPALWMVLYSGLAIGLVALDGWLDGRDTTKVPPILQIDPDDARAMLAAILGAMLTVVSLAFSLVMISVVQMSNAYSPQLLRSHLSDALNQHVLGILLGTSLYALLVLRSVRLAGVAPMLATNVGVALAVVATVALVVFLHHVPESIKVSSIIRTILRNCEEELERQFPAAIGEECEDIPSDEELRGEPLELRARRSGYVEIFDLSPLEARERETEVVIRTHACMGDFVLAGAKLASVWGDFDERDCEALERAWVFGTERTMRQDPRYGIEQLADVALRALSTGINDPTTACHVINALTVLLAKLLARDPVSRWRRDSSKTLRIEFQLAKFDELLELSYLRILAYGCGDQQVVRRLLAACEQLATVCESVEQREALWGCVEAIREAATQNIELGAHRRTLERKLERVTQALGHRRSRQGSISRAPRARTS
jgi:uncharacterized membrane protein